MPRITCTRIALRKSRRSGIGVGGNMERSASKLFCERWQNVASIGLAQNVFSNGLAEIGALESRVAELERVLKSLDVSHDTNCTANYCICGDNKRNIRVAIA